MIRIIVLDANGMYTSIYDEFYTDNDLDDRISQYNESGYICVKIKY